ncbi:hypothetical protein PMAYCL1PPCAC_16443, partial [Pristionchus mayeri]
MDNDQFVLLAYTGPCRLTGQSQDCSLRFCFIVHGYSHYVILVFSILIHRKLSSTVKMSGSSRKIHRDVMK